MRDDPDPTDDPPRPDRRGALLLLGGLVAAALILPPLVRRFAPLQTAPVAGLPGFRRIDGGGLSRAFDPLVRLERNDAAPLPAPAHAAVRADLCAALFPGWDGTTVPLAVFTDYNCAVCRRTEPDLVAWVAARDGAVTLFWHELPILGPTSVIAARGALAARALGAYDRFRARLMRSAVRADAAYLGSLAASVGVDAARLESLAGSQAVTEEIARSLALAMALGLPGTPGAVLGRTVVAGAMPDESWTRLLRDESPTATADACRQAKGV
jgi:protein-disulfide isomerase